MKIGNLQLEKNAALAPMAGVADRAFRTICKEMGACYVVGEMASAKGLLLSDKKTQELLQVTDAERPMAIQLFGDDPATMAAAAQKALAFCPDVIDINMGCPAPKIAGNGAGSALMKNPLLAAHIVKEVVKVSTVPVSVKFRKGYDSQHVNAVEFALRMQEAGASF